MLTNAKPNYWKIPAQHSLRWKICSIQLWIDIKFPTLMRFIINRWFNYIKLPSGWHTNTRNFVVQRCQSGGAFFHRRNIQRWHRVTNFNHTPRRHWRLYVHSTQWRRTGFSYGTRNNCGRRCNYGKCGAFRPERERELLIMYLRKPPTSQFVENKTETRLEECHTKEFRWSWERY